MADRQAEIARFCRLLDSDKATERKKSADSIKQLLQEEEILRLLDSNFDEGKKKIVYHGKLSGNQYKSMLLERWRVCRI